MWKFFCNIFGCHRNLPTGCECLIRSIHWWSRTKVVAILHKNGEGTLLCKVFVQVFNVWRCILSIISMNSLPFRFTRLQTMWGEIWIWYGYLWEHVDIYFGGLVDPNSVFNGSARKIHDYILWYFILWSIFIIIKNGIKALYWSIFLKEEIRIVNNNKGTQI